MDRKWWVEYGAEVTFAGERWSAGDGIDGVRMLPGGSDGGNSGAAAILLAKYHGARRIILLGYDCKPAENGMRHWHGKHRGRLTDAGSLGKFPAQFQRLAPRLGEIEVLNATRDTALTVWPCADFNKALRMPD
jgi:hypothetical protein